MVVVVCPDTDLSTCGVIARKSLIVRVARLEFCAAKKIPIPWWHVG